MRVDLRSVLEDLAALHSRDPGGGMGWREAGKGYGDLDLVCITCGTPDEYGVPWPCKTRRLVDDALVMLDEAGL